MTKTAILLYHRVGPLDGSFMDAYTVAPERFEKQLRQIECLGWSILSLNDVLRNDLRQKHCVVLTFDDGFRSNREHAWPILRAMKIPATTFLVSGEIGGANTWDGSDRARYPLLGASDVQEAGGEFMTFGSHTVRHRALPGLTCSELEEELRDSREKLSAFVGCEVDLLAYPFGAWNPTVVEAVHSAGYRAACSSIPGLNSNRTDRYLLRRVEVGNGDLGWRLAVKLVLGRSIGGRWSRQIRSNAR